MNKIINKGFTLIELVIVIVLVGILAAVAFPRFVNLADRARVEAAAGIAGALGSAVNVAHARWLADEQPITIQMADVAALRMSANGWPEGLQVGPGRNMVDEQKCLEVWRNIVQVAPPAEIGNACTGNCQYRVDVNLPNECIFTDRQGNGTNVITYNIMTGEVGL